MPLALIEKKKTAMFNKTITYVRPLQEVGHKAQQDKGVVKQKPMSVWIIRFTLQEVKASSREFTVSSIEFKDIIFRRGEAAKLPAN